MFSKVDTTKSKGWKKTIIAALAGIACVAVGSQFYESYDDSQDEVNIQALESYTQSLVDHRDYVAEQTESINELVKEGAENFHATTRSIEEAEDVFINFKGGKMVTTLKTKGKAATTGGHEQLTKNVKWGKKSEKNSVDAKKIQQTFADTAQFQAEISKMFPKSYAAISKLRQDLKIHHFDLMNTVKDVELLSQSTKDSLAASFRKLKLRKKYGDDGKLKPTMDAKIWKLEIKYLVRQLTDSQKRCKAVIVILKKLQKDCAKTQDNIENELAFMKVELKKQIARANVKIDQMENQIKAMKCIWWQAILTLGQACVKVAKAKSQLKTVQRDFASQLSVARKLQGKMFYFDGLGKTAALLVSEATGLLETTKKLENRIEDTKRELIQDFSDEEIDDNLWDEDFANEFAERLFESLTRLSKMCDEAIADCRARKVRLEKALIWGSL